MSEQRRRQWLWLSLLAVVLVTAAAFSAGRSLRMRFDFSHFYLDAAYVWQHGELNPDLDGPDRDARRQLPFYLPVVSLALSPLAAGGPVIAALLWSAAQVFCLFYCLRVLARWYGGDWRNAPWALIAAVALALPAIINAAQFNQLTFIVLALVLAGVDRAERGRSAAGGALLAAAAVLKLLPAIFALWLVLRRDWRGAAAFAAAAVVLIVAPPLAVFGPQRTAEYHRQWWVHNVQGASLRGMVAEDLEEHFVDRRNQSIDSVLARLLWPEHPYRTADWTVGLSAEACVRLGWAIKLVIVAGLIAAVLRSGRAAGLERRGVGAELMLLGMLVLSPLLRQYYLLWALPALAALCSLAGSADVRARLTGRAGVAVWLAGMILWTWPAARLAGAHLLMLLAMGVLLAAATWSASGRGDAAPAPRRDGHRLDGGEAGRGGVE